MSECVEDLREYLSEFGNSSASLSIAEKWLLFRALLNDLQSVFKAHNVSQQAIFPKELMQEKEKLASYFNDLIAFDALQSYFEAMFLQSENFNCFQFILQNYNKVCNFYQLLPYDTWRYESFVSFLIANYCEVLSQHLTRRDQINLVMQANFHHAKFNSILLLNIIQKFTEQQISQFIALLTDDNFLMLFESWFGLLRRHCLGSKESVERITGMFVGRYFPNGNTVEYFLHRVILKGVLDEEVIRCVARELPSCELVNCAFLCVTAWRDLLHFHYQEGRYRQLTLWIVLLMDRMMRDNLQDNQCEVALLSAVSSALDSNDKVVRRGGMEVAETYARWKGRELRFDELQAMRAADASLGSAQQETSPHNNANASASVSVDGEKKKAESEQRNINDGDSDSDSEEDEIVGYFDQVPGNTSTVAIPNDGEGDDTTRTTHTTTIIADHEDYLLRKRIPELRTNYLPVCLQLLLYDETKPDASLRHLCGLQRIPVILSYGSAIYGNDGSEGDSNDSLVEALLKQVVSMPNAFNQQGFEEHRYAAIAAIVAHHPHSIGTLTETLQTTEAALGLKVSVLSTMRRLVMTMGMGMGMGMAGEATAAAREDVSRSHSIRRGGDGSHRAIDSLLTPANATNTAASHTTSHANPKTVIKKPRRLASLNKTTAPSSSHSHSTNLLHSQQGDALFYPVLRLLFTLLHGHSGYDSNNSSSDASNDHSNRFNRIAELFGSSHSHDSSSSNSSSDSDRGDRRIIEVGHLPPSNSHSQKRPPTTTSRPSLTGLDAVLPHEAFLTLLALLQCSRHSLYDVNRWQRYSILALQMASAYSDAMASGDGGVAVELSRAIVATMYSAIHTYKQTLTLSLTMASDPVYNSTAPHNNDRIYDSSVLQSLLTIASQRESQQERAALTSQEVCMVLASQPEIVKCVDWALESADSESDDMLRDLKRGLVRLCAEDFDL